MVSVIVPVYNNESLIGACLDSILEQTYQDLQIIVVDDGSTDSSGRICDTYAQKDRRIQVYHIENCGPAAARKRGLSYAVGEYIGFVDGDDWIQSQMYEELLAEIVGTDADLVHFGFWEEADGQSIPHLKFADGVFDISGRAVEFIRKFVLREEYSEYESMTYSIWSKLFRRDIICEVFEKVPDDLKVGEDLVALCFCIMESRRITLRKKAYYQYRVGNGSLSHYGSGVDKVVQRVAVYNFLKRVFSQYHCLSEMEKSLHTYLTLHLYSGLQLDAARGVRVPFFQIDHIDALFGKKLVLYGAGCVGQDYYMQIKKYVQCRLAAWVDREYTKLHFDYAEVTAPDRLGDIDFDIILIAVEREAIAKEIRSELMAQGILESRILWNPPAYVYGWKEG